MAANPRYSLPPGQGAHNGVPTGSTARQLPHVQDLITFPTNIDKNQSIKRLLEIANTSLGQSQMFRDFNRPDTALKEYIKAYVIAVYLIGNHQDYPTLKATQGEQHRTHVALLQKIQAQEDAYSKIKALVVQDNIQTGVQPTVKGQKVDIGNSSRSATPSSIATQQPEVGKSQPYPQANGSPHKTKPAVHPKPQALHGNAIRTESGHRHSASKNSFDLQARFASLGGPQSSQGQDPRIKTHTIIPPRPVGPRQMPSPQKLHIDMEHPVSALPKIPDAIYSPARNSISADSSRPPISTPRSSYSRAGSISLSNNVTSTPAQQQQSNDYFSQVTTSRNNTGSVPESSTVVSDANSITPEELYNAMKRSSILIIDIRDREDFDEGHIMSKSIICVEPTILLRKDISAADISESLVVSPGQEQVMFDRRADYDLVVYYNQDSENIRQRSSASNYTAMLALHRALVDFNYGHELKTGPKILKGGLDGWTSLMSPASLQRTADPGLRAAIPPRRLGTMARRGSRHVSKPLDPAEAKKFGAAVDAENMNFFQIEADFLRRYPNVNTVKESMTSPSLNQPRSKFESHIDINHDLPLPPTRPAPAVPRPSYSGVTGDQDHDSSIQETSNPPLTTLGDSKYRTGLHNPHVWCYANSTLQSLFGSPGFSTVLADSKWTEQYSAPMRQGEKTAHPQLMIKILSNLFHWMDTGNFQAMKAQTLMDYSRHLCKSSETDMEFGGGNQQDAQEFMSFVMAELHDETNSNRHHQGQPDQSNAKNQSVLQAASEYWRNHTFYNNSIVDRYWRGLEASTVRCHGCGAKSHKFSPFEWLSVATSRSMTLEEALRQGNASDAIDNFDCESCGKYCPADKSVTLARIPELLCLCFQRFAFGGGQVSKSMSRITWDFNNVDFTPYFIARADRSPSTGITDTAFTGPFGYECYAVIMHVGKSVDKGHYFAYVRDSSSRDPYAWFKCNDSQVTKVRIGSDDRGDLKERVFMTGPNEVPYLAFFRRKYEKR